MTTLAIMKARIASEMARGSDITNAIADAINTAIAAYQKYRFRWNETLPGTEISFSTVAGQVNYLFSAITSRTIFRLDYLTVLVGTEVIRLKRVTDPAEIKVLNDAGTIRGYPDKFTVEGETVILYPSPDQVYSIKVAGIFSYAAPASDSEAGNRWMIDGELLIRSRAKFEVAVHVTRNPTMARAMSPDEHDDGLPVGAARRAFDELMRERNQVMATGRVTPTQF